MKGDFSRGYRPDSKRGKRYRRVLLQQGRVLLDSDHAAMVDSNETALRELGEDLAGSGSSNMGFYPSSGETLAHFDSLEQLEDLGDALAISRRYFDAGPPWLLVESRSAGAAILRIGLLREYAAGETIQVNARSPQGASVSIAEQDGSASAAMTLNDLDDASDSVITHTTNAAGSYVDVTIPAGTQVQLRSIEAAYQTGASLWLSAGRYWVDGLPADNPAPAPWPEHSFPSAAGFDNNSDPLEDFPGASVVAYLELRERLVTADIDPGLRERALGSSRDTTARTELVAQVMLLSSFGPYASDHDMSVLLPAALEHPRFADGTLEVNLASAAAASDPCGLPTVGGFTGTDNRLYHFEVHVGGALGVAALKWSRDGGSRVVEVVAVDGATVTLPATSDLRDGDLVELLSEYVELAEASPASIDANGEFVPCTRLAGQLALVSVQQSDAQGQPVFRLYDPDDPATELSLDTTYYGAAGERLARLRQWDGRLTTTAGAQDTLTIEHGVEIEIAGSFAVGDWWQWEARVLQANDNGSWQSTRHGPERRFTALATVSGKPAAGPTTLTPESFYRSHHSLAQLVANDVWFDPELRLSGPHTVQAALEDLYRRSRAGSLGQYPRATAVGDIEIGDEAFLPALGGEVHLQPGHYFFKAGVTIADDLTIRGAEGVVIHQVTTSPLFTVSSGGRLTLEDLTIVSDAAGSQTQLLVSAGAELHARRLACLGPDGSQIIAIGDGGSVTTPSPASSDAADVHSSSKPAASGGARVHLEECAILNDWCGIVLASAELLRLDRCGIHASHHAIDVALADRLELVDSVLAGDDDGYGDDDDSFREHYARATAPGSSSGPPVDSYAAVLGSVYAGFTRGCDLAGTGIAMFADLLWDHTIEGGHFRGQTAALHVNFAKSTQVRGPTLDADAHGIDNPFGAQHSSVRGCKITAQIGVATADFIGVAHTVWLDHLTIADNEIVATSCGVRCHDGSNTGVSGRNGTVVISGNRITEPTGGAPGSSAGISVIGFSGQDHLRSVADNRVHWSGSGVCIHAGGQALEIVGNHLSSATPAITTAFELEVEDDLVLRDNTIHKIGDLFDIQERGDIPKVTIQGNTHHGSDGSGNQRVATISNGVAELYLLGNHFPQAIIQVATGAQLIHLVVIGNQLGTLDAPGCLNVDVRDNLFMRAYPGEEGYAEIESLLLTEVQKDGIVSVTNNTAFGEASIRVVPTTVDGTEVNYTAKVSGNVANHLQVGWPANPVGFPAETSKWVEQGAGLASTSHILVHNNCATWMITNNYEFYNAVGNATHNDMTTFVFTNGAARDHNSLLP